MLHGSSTFGLHLALSKFSLRKLTAIVIDIGGCNNTNNVINIFTGLFAYYSTTSKNSDESWTDISYSKLMSMIKSQDIQLFDVRTPEEITETGMMPKATNVPCTYLLCSPFI